MERISSRQNAHFKLARKLMRSPRERAKSRRTLIEGARLVEAYANRFGLQGATLFFQEQRAKQEGAILAARFGRANPAHMYVVADGIFPEISPVDTSEGIIALIAIPNPDLQGEGDFRVLLDGVQDPGNVGALLRTAVAAGSTTAYLGKGCADAWSPKSLRGGMGAQFVMRVLEKADLTSVLGSFEGKVIATSPQAKESIFEVDLTGPVAMIFGAEGRGVGEELLALANQLVYIPMAGNVESLNVAAAAAVCCFERLRQVAATPMSGKELAHKATPSGR
jgi:TrmH family RNA methyltransferase